MMKDGPALTLTRQVSTLQTVICILITQPQYRGTVDYLIAKFVLSFFVLFNMLFKAEFAITGNARNRSRLGTLYIETRNAHRHSFNSSSPIIIIFAIFSLLEYDCFRQKKFRKSGEKTLRLAVYRDGRSPRRRCHRLRAVQFFIFPWREPF